VAEFESPSLRHFIFDQRPTAISQAACATGLKAQSGLSPNKSLNFAPKGMTARQRS
jgi:hypothetical protein